MPPAVSNSTTRLDVCPPARKGVGFRLESVELVGLRIHHPKFYLHQVMTDAFRDDLAYIHDAGFGGLARAAGPVLVAGLQRRGFAGGLVVDLGCGSGIVSRAVAEAGYDVLGIDLSPAMVALARERVPSGTFRVGSVIATEIPRCIAVAAIGEVFNYLFDSENNAA